MRARTQAIALSSLVTATDALFVPGAAVAVQTCEPSELDCPVCS